MTAVSNDEIWQVDSGDHISEVRFDEIAEWIHNGSLLRIDRVRKANLRWIEAGKVSALVEFFNAKDENDAIPPTVTTTDAASSSPTEPAAMPPAAIPPTATPPSVEPSARATDACSMHPDVPAAYVCDTCTNSFCKTCPSSYGSNVKICPFCGAMCKSLAEIRNARRQMAAHQSTATDGFGFADLGAAFAYPFKFKASLILGAVMYTMFSVGQSALGFGGMSMLGPAIFCFILANTLTFGVLANTVENFAQGKLDLDFMPSFEEFSIWDDVIHPFFLSIGVYISSFGPLVAVFLIAFFWVVAPAAREMNSIESDAARVVTPELPYAANAAKQSEAVRELLGKTKQDQQQRVAAIDEADAEANEIAEPPVASTTPGMTAAEQEEAEFAELNKFIQDSRKAQVESVVGKAPETVAKERSELFSQLLRSGLILLLVGGVCLLWGVLYFPAACAVAGYTRSFGATLNPAVGIDTIRRLGSYYVKILGMGLLIFIVYSFIAGTVEAVLSPFDLPSLGNLPAKAIAGLFGFYFSVVFSCVLGFALYKASDRLKLFR